MSSLRKAAKKIESQNQTIKRMRENSKSKENKFLAGGSVVAGTLLAAYLDVEKGEPGEVAELAGMPMNAVLGLAAMAGSLVLPTSAKTAQTLIGFSGVGLFSSSLYRIAYEKLQEREDAKAAG